MEEVITWKIEKQIEAIRNDGSYVHAINDIELMRMIAIEYDFVELEGLLNKHPNEYMEFLRTGGCRAWN